MPNTENGAGSGPHIIQSSLPSRYPRGWFCIGADYEFGPQPKRLNYFGSAQVSYRGESGQLVVLDAHCPHMGANLADGCVKGDAIVCPFHEWHWGADGVCSDIPYAKKIPDRARIKSWPVREVNQLIYLWNDPDGGEPIAEQAIEEDPRIAQNDWTPWVIRRIDVASNCRELIDNMADKAHFGPVHGIGEVKHFSNISEGHTYTQVMTANGPVGELTSTATYYGPSYMIHHNVSNGSAEYPPREFLSLVINVPTGLKSFEFLAGFKEKIPAGLEGDRQAQIDHVNATIEETIERSVFADLKIWENKVPIDNPILCDGDGPVSRLRQWYQQFLVPIDQVPASLQQRRIYDKSDD